MRRTSAALEVPIEDVPTNRMRAIHRDLSGGNLVGLSVLAGSQAVANGGEGFGTLGSGWWNALCSSILLVSRSVGLVSQTVGSKYLSRCIYNLRANAHSSLHTHTLAHTQLNCHN